MTREPFVDSVGDDFVGGGVFASCAIFVVRACTCVAEKIGLDWLAVAGVAGAVWLAVGSVVYHVLFFDRFFMCLFNVFVLSFKTRKERLNKQSF